jgi:rhamnosyltransferase
MSMEKKKVLILMSTYNGEKYLKEQIDSLLRQEAVDLDILVRDDGSSDLTLNILNEYSDKGLLTWYVGENIRPAKSFMDLIHRASNADYYAFCDQDDVWNDDKLFIAIKKLEELADNNKPKLYCSNYQLVDESLNILPDNNHVSTITFKSALVSSCATGCTIVFNRKLLLKLQSYTPQNLVMHDDWAHKVCLALDGRVVYDDRKTLKYRQHGNNVDGGVHTITSRIQRIFQRISSKECIRSKQIQDLIKGYSSEMNKENLSLACTIANYKKSKGTRWKILFSRSIKTPYSRLNQGFKLAIFLGYF